MRSEESEFAHSSIVHKSFLLTLNRNQTNRNWNAKALTKNSKMLNSLWVAHVGYTKAKCETSEIVYVQRSPIFLCSHGICHFDRMTVGTFELIGFRLREAFARMWFRWYFAFELIVRLSTASIRGFQRNFFPDSHLNREFCVHTSVDPFKKDAETIICRHVVQG